MIFTGMGSALISAIDQGVWAEEPEWDDAPLEDEAYPEGSLEAG